MKFQGRRGGEIKYFKRNVLSRLAFSPRMIIQYKCKNVKLNLADVTFRKRRYASTQIITKHEIPNVMVVRLKKYAVFILYMKVS